LPLITCSQRRWLMDKDKGNAVCQRMCLKQHSTRLQRSCDCQ
jgi:hypothetical protein